MQSLAQPLHQQGVRRSLHNHHRSRRTCLVLASRKGGSSGSTAKAQAKAKAEVGSAQKRGRLSWPTFLGSLFVSGAAAGTLLDAIHSKELLQIYKVLPVDYGNLHTSLVVPPLLGAFYIVLGSLFGLMDDRLPTNETKEAQQRASDPAFVALAVGVLAADLQLSAYLYSQGTPFPVISASLAAAAALTWGFFDRTPQGLGLAAFCALGAPLSELIILSQISLLWVYPKADLDFGPLGSFVSWVPWCYFFYAPVLGTWARYLWQVCRTEEVDA